MEQKQSRMIHVQQTLLHLLPRLAAFDRPYFVQTYLGEVVSYLLNMIRYKEKNSNMAFVTIGFIAVAVEKEIDKFLPRIMDVLKAALPPIKEAASSKKRNNPDPAIFMCITLLGHASKGEIAGDIKELLESMFATGLSPALTVCLHQLAATMPELKREIIDGLLKMLSQVLMSNSGGGSKGSGGSGGGGSQVGTPKHHHLTTTTTQFPVLSTSESGPFDVQTIVLALKTLGNFDFEGHSLLQFVQRCADHFLNHEQQDVRIEAVTTCALLLQNALDRRHSSSASNGTYDTLKETVANVLEKLLVVGITDPEPNVRLRVLKCIDSRFDSHLAQPESLSALLVTLNDEVFEIRELAIVTIGR